MSKGKKGQKIVNKKKKEKIEEVTDNFNGNIKSVLFVVIGVLCFILAFYILTLFITGKDNASTTDNDTTQDSSFSYTKIPAGRSFSIDNGEYLVVYYNEEEDNSIEESIHTYRNSNNLKLYTVDMGDPINTKYKSEESNTTPSKASELKIKGSTLIRFNDNNVEEYIEGNDSIIDYLNK